MFPPDLIRPKMNRRVSGKVFTYDTGPLLLQRSPSPL